MGLKRGCCVWLLFVLVFAGGAPAASRSSWVAVDLGAFAPRAVSASGQVVGWRGTESESRAVSWTPADGMVDLGTLGGATSQAWAVNASGQVVGNSLTASGERHAFLWTKAGGMVDLGTLGGLYSDAVAVRASGQVVGKSTIASGEVRAFSWTKAGGMVNLGTLGGSSYSDARAANDSGQVVGISPGTGHAFSWTKAGGMVDLGTLGGSLSVPTAVSASGQVVGYSGHAFSWTEAGGMVDLGTLGGKGSQAWAVSASGQVVGKSRNAKGRLHAFSWTRRGGMVDLGTLGGTLSSAAAVNASGLVVGFSTTARGARHAFVWTSRGGMVDLGPGDAVDVNASAQVVGASSKGATLWQPGVAPVSYPDVSVGPILAGGSPAFAAVTARGLDLIRGAVVIARFLSGSADVARSDRLQLVAGPARLAYVYSQSVPSGEGSQRLRFDYVTQRYDGVGGATTLLDCGSDAQGGSIAVGDDAVAYRSDACSGDPDPNGGDIIVRDFATPLAPPITIAVRGGALLDFVMAGRYLAASVRSAANNAASVVVYDRTTAAEVYRFVLPAADVVRPPEDLAIQADGTVATTWFDTRDGNLWCRLAWSSPASQALHELPAPGGPCQIGALVADRIALVRAPERAPDPVTGPREVALVSLDGSSQTLARFGAGALATSAYPGGVGRDDVGFDGVRVTWAQRDCAGVTIRTRVVASLSVPLRVAAPKCRPPEIVRSSVRVVRGSTLRVALRCATGCHGTLLAYAAKRPSSYVPYSRRIASAPYAIARGARTLELPLTRRGQQLVARPGGVRAFLSSGGMLGPSTAAVTVTLRRR